MIDSLAPYSSIIFFASLLTACCIARCELNQLLQPPETPLHEQR